MSILSKEENGLRRAHLQFGPEKLKVGDVCRLRVQPLLLVRLATFVVPRWSRFFWIKDIHVGANSVFIHHSGGIPAYEFRAGSEASNVVRGHTCQVGQLIAIEAEFVGGETIMLNCQLREEARRAHPSVEEMRPRRGKKKQAEWDAKMAAYLKNSPTDYPHHWKDIDQSTLRLLHPANPRHTYQVGVHYDFKWEIPKWVDARLDCPAREGEWTEGFDPDIEVEQGTLEAIAFGAYMTGECIE